jgi:hypothetical protein
VEAVELMVQTELVVRPALLVVVEVVVQAAQAVWMVHILVHRVHQEVVVRLAQQELQELQEQVVQAALLVKMVHTLVVVV